MTDRIAFIVPYFGKFPNYFNLWLKSASKNQWVDVFFFSDNDEPQGLSENIHWVKTTFTDVKSRAQALIEFPIVLDQPYKLVDYKPLYGAMFQDYIKNYDWWAYGDIDTIWGDLGIILKHVQDNYDKILDLGHLTLIRNNERMNNLWHEKVDCSWTYEDAFKSNLIYHFDEGGGLAPIAKESGCKLYSEKPGYMNFADISPFKSRFEIAYDSGDGCLPHIFSWENGVLTGYWAKNGKDYAYVHLQKRKMQILIDDLDSNDGFLIVPNKFLPLNESEITPEFIESQYADSIGEIKHKSFVQRVNDYLKFYKFRTEGRKRHIPLNSNEVYFGTEEARY